MEPYIIGGYAANIEQFPHSVYMFLTCYGGSWICGASILTQNIVLSVAHCFHVCPRDLDVVLYVGSANLQKMKVSRQVSLYMIHEKFDLRTNRDDIALARTEHNFPLGRNIKRVIITKKFPKATRAEIAGWGILDEKHDQGANTLQWLTQTFPDGGVCSTVALLPGMICTENHLHSRPSLGDSGCALMTNLVQQIGMTSFRHRGLIQLVIYTNVSYYYDWIQRNTRKMACETFY